ncbi:hypothetical protein Cob_v005384 [Colletotrichum orbiculare MAFF 240422]|uniref:Uncharacterized protein n=1 Tax=Colletotrichum orbiculare (strain 104-T / ATCC 96160 / CBS 514.97 / LARS 414 / MAFF 240422) TaxID=1213857 RepID=A0A484FUQ6_COLOR|nr:hypothetical protein Cob_v005384 [Colletotrichum orbiculare MAFF 240422]
MAKPPFARWHPNTKYLGHVSVLPSTHEWSRDELFVHSYLAVNKAFSSLNTMPLIPQTSPAFVKDQSADTSLPSEKHTAESKDLGPLPSRC